MRFFGKRRENLWINLIVYLFVSVFLKVCRVFDLIGLGLGIRY